MSSSVFQLLMQLIWCKQRAPSPKGRFQTDKDLRAQAVTTKMSGDVGLPDSRSTDISDASSQSHTDSGSETADVPNAPTSNILPPPGLAPPPGLNPKPGVHEASAAMTRSFLVEKDRSARRTKTCNGSAKKSAPVVDPLVALKEALDKLAPTEIATVRSLLDSKACDGPARSKPPWATSKHQGDSERAPRPFKPFTASAKPFVMMPEPGESLQTFLQDLAVMNDDARILQVRKIQHLGFDSGPLLKNYFSAFGTVERVMVAPTLVKCKLGQGGAEKRRARPAALGFIVMSSCQEAQAVLARGETHIVGGVEIGAFAFQSRSMDAD